MMGGVTPIVLATPSADPRRAMGIDSARGHYPRGESRRCDGELTSSRGPWWVPKEVGHGSQGSALCECGNRCVAVHFRVPLAPHVLAVRERLAHGHRHLRDSAGCGWGVLVPVPQYGSRCLAHDLG